MPNLDAMKDSGNTRKQGDRDITVFSCEMTHDQKRELRIKAAKANKSMSDYVRDLIFGEPERQKCAA